MRFLVRLLLSALVLLGVAYLSGGKLLRVDSFTAEILASNTKMIALARSASSSVTVRSDGETYEVEMLF